MESAHLPVVLTLGKPHDKAAESVPQWTNKTVEDPTKEYFLLPLNSVEVQRFFQRTLKEIEYNIDVALSMLTDGIMHASQCG